jgi:DNA-binding NarL/FixJ family response regulator
MKSRESDHLFKIILADDHVLVRRGIKRIIEAADDLRVVAEADDGLELLELLQKISPHLVICDIAMPRLRGLEACSRLKELYPHIKVLILSMHKSKEYARQAMEAGMEGYLLKEDADTALSTAIQAIRFGKTYFPPLLLE